MTAQSNAPVIIKRKKITSGDGHHGGAWKVAYADFVTAMMAFFMLMWLLGATNEKQRKGIADYFTPTIPVVRASGGGSGAFGGDSIFSEATLSRNGTGATQARPAEERQARGETGVDSSEDADASASASTASELDQIQQALLGQGGESMISELMQRHIVTRLSDEGLVIELFETDDSALFDGDGAATPLLESLIASMTPVFELVVNHLAVQAHTRAVPIVAKEDRSWDITTARAEQVRSLLELSGFPGDRIDRITGFADRRPVTQNPMARRNDRIEIILLRDRL